MDANKNILGCFVSSHASLRKSEKAVVDLEEAKGTLFRSYVWGRNGICDTLKQLKHEDYGKDLILVLFQFYVNPFPRLLQDLKEIEGYRRNEKSIGIPIIVNDENFFDKSEIERRDFFERTILKKLDLVEQVVRRKKLDTNMELLRSDLKKLLSKDS